MYLRPIRVFCSIVLALFVMSPAMLSAEADETPSGASGPEQPEDTDIILPTEILEIEDIQLEVIEAPLPEFTELTLPDLAIPLPDPEDLAITEAALDIDPSAPAADTITTVEERSVFSSGRIAVGTRNHIAADIAVYVLGDGPRFTMQYSHDGLDGYADRAPGTGFFDRNDRIFGELEIDGERSEFGFEAAFDEREDGLQQQSDDFYSVGRRFISGSARGRLGTDGAFSARAGARAESAERLFVTDSGDPGSDSAVRFGGDIAGILEFDRADIDLTVDYDARLSPANELAHVLDARLGTGIALGVPIVLDAESGVSWRVGGDLMVPFEVGISGTIDDVLTLRLRGGQRPLRPSFTEIWKDVAVAGLDGQAPTDGREWFGRAGANWMATSALTMDAALGFAASRDDYDIGAFDGGASRYPLVQREIIQLRTDLTASWRPTQVFRLTGEHTGRFIDRRAVDPVHVVGVNAELTTPDERAGTGLRLSVPFFDEPALPLLGFDAHASLADGVELGLSLDDILSPVREQPRATVGATASDDYPFIEPGFRATLSARLTL